MRIVKYEKVKITKADMEEKLNMKIDKVEQEGDFIRIRKLKSNPREADASVYLRCGDVRTLFSISFNLFDKNYSIKNNTIHYRKEIETFRGNVGRWNRLRKKMKQLTGSDD